MDSLNLEMAYPARDKQSCHALRLTLLPWIVWTIAFVVPVSTLLLLRPGAVSRAVPLESIRVQPGDSLGDMVDRHPPGSRFELKGGIYRLETVSPKDGDVFIGEPGSVLSGAQLLSAFTKKGPHWAAKVQVDRRISARGECASGYPACKLPEDLFIDDAPQKRVESLAELVPGSWFLDYESGQVLMKDDPTGHRVEISILPKAFSSKATNIRIEGLVIEKYATSAGEGAIDASSSHPTSGKGWTVVHCEVRFNHGAGIRLGDRMRVVDNKIHHNGQLGIAGTGDDALIEGNEIAYNNYARYHYGWEAGGVKVTHSRNVVMRDNNVHDNFGPGLWADIDNENVTYERNRTSGNQVAGILHEISGRATIVSNVVTRDGADPQGKNTPWYAAGILIAGSSNVDVHSNRVIDCLNGIVGTQPDRKSQRDGSPYLLRDLYVHDNWISQPAGIAAGIVSTSRSGDSVFTGRNNRFERNSYILPGPSGRFFAWKNTTWTLSGWKAHFQEN